MNTEEKDSEKKETAVDDLVNIPLEIFAEEGMDLRRWAKEVVKLTKAKKHKPQKLTGTVKNESLKRGVKQVAESDKEGLVILSLPDNEIRHAALTLIGKSCDFVDPDAMNLKAKEPVVIEIHEEQEGGVGVNPET